MIGHRFLGLYLILEPTARNGLQVAAGVAAIAEGLWLLGVILMLWAVADLAIKAYSGTIVWRRGSKQDRRLRP